MSDVVDRFVAAVAGATLGDEQDVFAPDAVLDATVPGWRFSAAGDRNVREVFAGWFADEGRFEELRRTPLPEGELVEFALAWEEHGVLHACHQVHVLTLADGRIVADTAFCGGRWPAPLLARMEADRAGR